MPIRADGIWVRNVPWVKNGVGKTDIQRNILNSPHLREAHYMFGSGERVAVSAAELRRALEVIPSRLGTKLGPYEIDPLRKLINNIPIEMEVNWGPPVDLVVVDGGDTGSAGGISGLGGEEAPDRVLRMVSARRGQPAFRKLLFRIYGGKCALSGVGIADLLEACHINPYKGRTTNVASNGLLLRADLHTLFDLHLLSFNPISFRASFHPRICGDPHVAHLQGRAIRLPHPVDLQPNLASLTSHYEEHQKLI